MKLTPSLVIILILISVPGVCAQQVRLNGKVSHASPNERGSEIKIQVRNRNTGQLVEGEQTSTKVDDWFHVAYSYTLIDIEFDGGPCYRGDGHPQIRLSRYNRRLPEITLQKTRECKIKERRQLNKMASVSATASASTGGGEAAPRRSGGAASIKEIEVGEYTYDDDDLIPSPEELKQELEEEAAHARNGEFFDTFQYKLALKAELYRDRPELIKVLTDFRTKKENSVFFQAIGQIRPEMFTDVVRRELQTPGDVNLDNVFAVVREESVSQNIRGTANVALLRGTISDDKLSLIREYYRQQSPSSPIFATSLVALGRIGEAEDQAKLYGYITDGSGETQNIAIEALYFAKLMKGPQAFSRGSETLAAVVASNKDPLVRASAIRSLRAFVSQGDETAFKVLLDGSNDPDPAVRLQAVLALGVGKTEQNPTVRNLLRNVSSNDRSPEVRMAARLALSGASTTDRFSQAQD